MNEIVQTVEEKRAYVSGKIIIGIDPAKDKHQVRILDADEIPIGKTFSFKNDYNGFTKSLWRKLNRHLDGDLDYRKDVVFAIETACDLWQPLVHFLYKAGYSVVRISPLSTFHSRVQIGNDFSRTDPKDALVIASNAATGNFTMHTEHDVNLRSLRTLSITFDKLRKDIVRNKNRIMSFVNRYFPEFIKVLTRRHSRPGTC